MGEELVAAARYGDRRALEKLLQEHADLMYRVCRGVMGNHEDALDATQQAMIGVARGIEKFDGRSAFSTWLYRVCTNAALDEVRKRARQPIPVEELPELADQASSAETAVTSSMQVQDLLAQVPEEYRTVLALREVADMDYAEIASVLDIPIGTVRSRLARGRAVLGQILVGNQTESPERLKD